MDTAKILDKNNKSKAFIIFLICLVILIFFSFLSNLSLTAFGEIDVKTVTFKNYNGLTIRARLLMPEGTVNSDLLPGIVYVHGYQSCREISDPYCIELARRGFVVLNIDAIGRGNSDVALDDWNPNFDTSFGTKTSVEYLRALPYVNASEVGLMGHSTGADKAYNLALEDSGIAAIVITGFAYREDATPSNPKNMLMIFGRWDEFRGRMINTENFETTDVVRDWMNSPQTQAAFPVENPEASVTYGDFELGTARRVFFPNVIHMGETLSNEGISEALLWMRQALNPPAGAWKDAAEQVWHLKEWSNLIAMLACFASLFPLGLMLLRMEFFNSLITTRTEQYAYTCTGKPYIKGSIINGILMWLYLPSLLIIFMVHKYVVRIDIAFPMIMVNVLAWWFLLSNGIGYFIFKSWFKKKSKINGLTMLELGISYREDRFSLDKAIIGKTALLAGILFGFAYIAEYILELVFQSDFRFVFSFANDLTPYRWLMFLQYLPFFFLAFILNGIFLHGQMRRPKKETWLKTFTYSTLFNLLIMLIPLILMLCVQYITFLTTGIIPFEFTGGVFVIFVQNIMHIIGVLIIILPLSTWFNQLTGKIYLSAALNALLVTWMLVSTQVAAPVPV